MPWGSPMGESLCAGDWLDSQPALRPTTFGTSKRTPEQCYAAWRGAVKRMHGRTRLAGPCSRGASVATVRDRLGHAVAGRLECRGRLGADACIRENFGQNLCVANACELAAAIFCRVNDRDSAV